jgi:meso-butanediol dehydrogenase/(S,S)-butanediol dehydrogenase/diacetyl reductase
VRSRTKWLAAGFSSTAPPGETRVHPVGCADAACGPLPSAREPVLVADRDVLEGASAIVTGGASGMGAATVRLLASRGAQVLVVDQDELGATSIAAETNSHAAIGDVTDPVFCEQTVAAVAQTNGRLDILVNAAGVIVRSPAFVTSDEEWRRIFAVNVDGVFFMCRAAISVMRTQASGAIVNFGSIWGEVGSAGHAAYAATKGAVHQLTRSMALEHAREGIRVNAVCPGEIRTPMLASGRLAPPTEADLAALASATIPMGRLGEPDEVARVVAFLASSDASYMTGAMVPVDAGYTAQ